MNQNDLYVDGINNVYVTGNLVRLELATLQPHLRSENGEPVYQVGPRIVMPLEAFVKSFLTQNDIMQQLIKAGIVNINQEQPKQTDSPSQAE